MKAYWKPDVEASAFSRRRGCSPRPTQDPDRGGTQVPDPAQVGSYGSGVFDCVIVSAGPAGLAASDAMTAAGIDHVVLLRTPGVECLVERTTAHRGSPKTQNAN
jgi:hypothetical protein